MKNNENYSSSAGIYIKLYIVIRNAHLGGGQKRQMLKQLCVLMEKNNGLNICR